MIDKEEIIENFVRNFILKDKRERCLLELMNSKKRYSFTDKLNHKWESLFDMRCLNQIDKSSDNSEAIKKLVGLKIEEVCYVISNYEEFDDKLITFGNAFDELYCRGLGSIIINLKGNVIFLDTEQERGGTPRFIGRSNKGNF